jgi:hypothetical protein
MNDAQQTAAKLRKIAEDNGLDDQQLAYAAQMVKYARENPQGFLQEINQFYGGQVPNQQPEIDPDNPFDGDPQFNAAVQKQVAMIEKRLAEQYGKPLQQLTIADQMRQKQQFDADQMNGIKAVLGKYSDSGVTEQQVKEVADKLKIPNNQLYAAFIEAIGGPDKYEEYQKKRFTASYSKEVQEKNKSVTTPMGGGTPVAQAAQLPKLGTKDSINSTLEMIRAQTNQRRE